MPSAFLPWIMSTSTSAPSRTTVVRIATPDSRPIPGASAPDATSLVAAFFDLAAARAGCGRPPRGVLLAMVRSSLRLEGGGGRIAAPDGVHLVQDQGRAHRVLDVLDADLALVLGAAVDVEDVAGLDLVLLALVQDHQ